MRSHLVSDVPLGAFLSGGVDSSLVVGADGRGVVAAGEDVLDRLRRAGVRRARRTRGVAQHFGTDHHEFVVRPDALAILDRLVAHFDEPFADPSAIPTWYVSELARRHVTVVLSGDGGDELFGGYDRYLPHARVARFDTLPVPGKRALAGLAARTLPHGARGKNFLRHVARDDGEPLPRLDLVLRPRGAARAARPRVRGARARRRRKIACAHGSTRVRHLPLVSRMMQFDFETYLPEDVLTKVDRMSMAHSIESRVPLLDHPVVEFALRLPLRAEDAGRPAQAPAEARGARACCRRRSSRGRSRDSACRSASGSGASCASVPGRAALAARAAARLLRAARSQRLLDEHLAGRRDHALRLWQLLMFELWHRAYLDHAGAGDHG